MTTIQLGNDVEVAASDPVSPTLLARITADGGADNVVVVNDTSQLEVGMLVDFRVRSTGSATGGAVSRLITIVDPVAETITYSGADVDIADATFGVYFAGGYSRDPRYGNINGGLSISHGFTLGDILTSVGTMRSYLKTLSDAYTDAMLNQMTRNDMIYAVRLNHASGKGVESFGLTPKLYEQFLVVTD